MITQWIWKDNINTVYTIIIKHDRKETRTMKDIIISINKLKD